MIDSDYVPLWCALNRFIANYWADVDAVANRYFGKLHEQPRSPRRCQS